MRRGSTNGRDTRTEDPTIRRAARWVSEDSRAHDRVDALHPDRREKPFRIVTPPGRPIPASPGASASSPYAEGRGRAVPPGAAVPRVGPLGGASPPGSSPPTGYRPGARGARARLLAGERAGPSAFATTPRSPSAPSREDTSSWNTAHLTFGSLCTRSSGARLHGSPSPCEAVRRATGYRARKPRPKVRDEPWLCIPTAVFAGADLASDTPALLRTTTGREAAAWVEAAVDVSERFVKARGELAGASPNDVILRPTTASLGRMDAAAEGSYFHVLSLRIRPPRSFGGVGGCVPRVE